MTKKRICVIGAGAAGLPAIKSCLEEDFDVICYEKTDNIGGLWRYREEMDGVGRTSKSTINNTSKEMNSYSDFPMPKEFPVYLHNTQMVEYFELYAKHFDLLSRIKLNHTVLKVVKNVDYEESGKWSVCVSKSDQQFEMKFVEIFDGVMVCTGHHSIPLTPRFQGQELFKGKIIHSKSFDSAEGYANKRVVVVGIGSSACDVANELSFACDQVYLSSRRGTWIWPRVGPNGIPSDHYVFKRINHWIASLLPYSLVCWYYETFFLNDYFDHELYGVRPDVRCFSIHPTINDIIPSRILSGRIIVKKNIDRFVEDGVIFIGEQEVTKCDEVVMGTGYHFKFPILDNSILEQNEDNYLKLYNNVFPPELSPHNSLAIIGAIQPNGAMYPLYELQCRWYALLMAGKCQLPSKQEMLAETEATKQRRDMMFGGSSRSTIEVMWTDYIDGLAKTIGVYPDLKKYAFADFALWRQLVFGTTLSYHYRLDGPHSWSGARNAIMGADDRIEYGLRKSNSKSYRCCALKASTYRIIVWILLFIIAFFIFDFFD